MKTFITTLFAFSLAVFTTSCELQSLTINPRVDVPTPPPVVVEVSPFAGVQQGQLLVVNGTVKKAYFADGLHWIEIQSGNSVIKTSSRTFTSVAVGQRIHVQGIFYSSVRRGQITFYLTRTVVL